METVITTLDPQMKDYICAGSEYCVVVASDKDVKVNPIREAFSQVLGRATTVFGVAAQGSTIADQPLGFAAGRQAAQERIQFVKSKDRDPKEALVVVAVEGFLLEVNDEDWVEMSCLILNDDLNQINLVSYTQPTKVDADVINDMKDSTPDTYPKRWSGLAKTVGQAVEDCQLATRKDWHQVLGGIPRSQLIHTAALSLAFQYQKALSKLDS